MQLGVTVGLAEAECSSKPMQNWQKIWLSGINIDLIQTELMLSSQSLHNDYIINCIGFTGGCDNYSPISLYPVLLLETLASSSY